MEIGKASCHQKLFSERENVNDRVYEKKKGEEGIPENSPRHNGEGGSGTHTREGPASRSGG